MVAYGQAVLAGGAVAAELNVQNQGTATFPATVGGAATTDVDWSVEGTSFNPKGTITAGGCIQRLPPGRGWRRCLEGRILRSR